MKKIKFILISILILIASLSLFACTGGATNSYDYDEEETSWEEELEDEEKSDSSYEENTSQSSNSSSSSQSSVQSYTINIVSPVGGTITSTKSSAIAGTTVVLTISANSGYKLNWVKVNGTQKSVSGTKCTFTMPSQNVTITSEFVKVYTLNAISSNGGTLSFSNNQYLEGDTVTVTASPKAHFTFTNINFAVASSNASISQSTISYTKNGNTVTFKMPAYNVKMTPVFTEDAKYTITINYVKATDNSTLSTSKTITDYKGATYSQQSPSITGYTADKTTVSGTISGNATITVKYTLNKISITVKYVGVNGLPSKVESVDYGSTYNIASPSVPGYLPDIQNVTGTATTDKTITVTYTIVSTGNMLQEMTFTGVSGAISNANFQGPKSTTAIASNGFVQSTEGESLYMVTNTSNQLINASKLYFEVELKVTEKSSDPAPKIGLAVTNTADVNSIYGGNFIGNFVFMDIRDIPAVGAFGANVWCNYTTNNGGWTTWETSSSYQKANATNFNTEFIKYAIYKDGSNFTAYINNQVLFTWTNTNLSGNAHISILCFNTKFQAQNAKWGDYNPNVGSANTSGELKGSVQSNNIYFQTYFDPVALTKDDAYSKAGIYIANNAGDKLFFYADLACGDVTPLAIKENHSFGHILKSAGNSDFSWGKESFITIPNINTLNKNKYAIYKEGASISFLVNDICLFTLNNQAFNTNCYVGIDAFNVSYSYSDAQYSTSTSNLPTIKSIYSIGTNLTIDGSLLDWSAEKKANSYGVTATDNTGRGFKTYAFLGTNGIYVAYEILSNSYNTNIAATSTDPAWCLNTNVELAIGTNKVPCYVSAYGTSKNVRCFAIKNETSGSLKKTTFEFVIPYQVGGYTTSSTEVKLGFACRPGSESAPGICEGNANVWWSGPRHCYATQSTVKVNGIFA